MENPTPSKLCISCKAKLPVAAKLCGTCGTTQNDFVRWFVKLGSMAGILAVLASLVTTAVALWPQAMSSIFPNPRPSLYEFKFDSHSVAERRLGVFGLLNGGNVDAYVHKILFVPKDPRLQDVPSRGILTAQWVKISEIVEKRIGNPDSKRRQKDGIKPRPVSTGMYSDIRDALVAQNLFDPTCFFLHPYNAYSGIKAPQNGRFRNKTATTIVKVEMQYTTANERVKPKTAEVSDLYVEATLFLKPRCNWLVDNLDDPVK